MGLQSRCDREEPVAEEARLGPERHLVPHCPTARAGRRRPQVPDLGLVLRLNVRIPPRARATRRTNLCPRFKVTEVAFMMDWDDSGSSSDDDTDGITSVTKAVSHLGETALSTTRAQSSSSNPQLSKRLPLVNRPSSPLDLPTRLHSVAMPVRLVSLRFRSRSRFGIS